MDFINNLTQINLLGFLLTAVIVISGISVKLYTRKRLKNLDGFCGVTRKKRGSGKYGE